MSESEVAQSCRTLCDPVDPPGSPPSMGFSRQEYWSGLPFPSPADLPDPGIEPSSPTLQADALTPEPDPNTEQDRKVTAAVQNATQGYRVLYEERNRAATQASLNPFFQRVDGVDPGRDHQRPCRQRPRE